MDFLTDAAHLNVGSLELSANHNITQIVEIIDESNKQQRLMSILGDIMNKVLICSCCYFILYTDILCVYKHYKSPFILMQIGRFS